MLGKGAYYETKDFHATGLCIITRETISRYRTIFDEDNSINLTDERKAETRQEVSYTDTLTQLEIEIFSAIDNSTLRKDRDSVRYILKKVWENYSFTAELVFDDITEGAWHMRA